MGGVMTDELAPARRGRPRKFVRPSRPVTVTLPEDVIATLRAIDADIGRAIVRLAEPHAGATPEGPAVLRTFGARSVIIVPRNTLLGERTGVELVPLPDGRALIAFDERLSAPQIELRVADAVADAALPAADRALFESLGGILRDIRRSSTLRLRERRILVVHRRRARSPQRQPDRTGRSDS
jgi:hypothetical protein